MLAKHGFQFAGEYAHAVDLEHLLAPPKITNETLFGNHAAVTRMQPAIAQRLGTGLGFVPVAL